MFPDMSKLRCIGLSLAAKIIGAYTMSVSILMINMLMSDYFSNINEPNQRTRRILFFDACASWAILGLNWIQAIGYINVNSVQIAVVWFLIYSLSFLMASVFLTLGSISRKPKYAVPWLCLQMISIIDQSLAISIHLNLQKNDELEKSRFRWYIPLSCVYLIFSLYLWIVVRQARIKWLNDGQNQTNNCENTISSPPSASNDDNCSKTPSFLSQNSMMCESPQVPELQQRPIIAQRYSQTCEEQ